MTMTAATTDRLRVYLPLLEYTRTHIYSVHTPALAHSLATILEHLISILDAQTQQQF